MALAFLVHFVQGLDLLVELVICRNVVLVQFRVLFVRSIQFMVFGVVQALQAGNLFRESLAIGDLSPVVRLKVLVVRNFGCELFFRDMEKALDFIKLCCQFSLASLLVLDSPVKLFILHF